MIATYGHIKKFLFPVPARINFGKVTKKLYFYFIVFDVFCTTINCFLVKEDPFFLKITFLYDFKICFYNRNTFLMICAKCKIIPVSKISIWPCRKDKNKNRTRASLFQSSEDGKQEFFFMWPNETHRSYTFTIYLYTDL